MHGVDGPCGGQQREVNGRMCGGDTEGLVT